MPIKLGQYKQIDVNRPHHESPFVVLTSIIWKNPVLSRTRGYYGSADQSQGNLNPTAEELGMSDDTVKCPHCLGEKPAAASVCMHCGRDRKGFGPRVSITSGARMGIGIFILLPLWIIGAIILLLIGIAVVKGITGGKTGAAPYLSPSTYIASAQAPDWTTLAKFQAVMRTARQN